jgi:hypothetical protein
MMYKSKVANDVQIKSGCLFWDPLQSEHHVEFLNIKPGGS